MRVGRGIREVRVSKVGEVKEEASGAILEEEMESRGSERRIIVGGKAKQENT